MDVTLWFSNLVFWSAQAALLVLTGGLLLRVLPIQHPRIVLLCWRVLLVVTLGLPFIQPWHRPKDMETLILPSANATAPLTHAPDARVNRWHFANLQLLAEIFGIIILAGIAARFVILVLGLVKLRQLGRQSSSVSPYPETAALLEEIGSRMKIDADFRLSPDVRSPVTFGFAVPLILLPQNFPLMNSGFQAAIACHELLHVRRCDWAHHLSEELIRTCFWFHPAIAWLIGRVRLAREQTVDFEVVTLTNARKTYLKALLEFTADRAYAIVPAPLFLAERQLAERIDLMLKEVRMSRTRLIISLTVITCFVFAAVTLAAWTFPLKGSPLSAQIKPISSAVNGQSPGASVDRDSIWTDTVKSGSMALQVRGSGRILRGEGSGNRVARVTVPASAAAELHTDQSATVNTQQGVVKAHVIRVNEASTGESRSVDLGFDSALPPGIPADHPVSATIRVGELNNVLWINRPANTEANLSKALFKIFSDGTGAERVNVKFGRASAQTIEVLDGLRVGDKIILSDMSEWEKYERIRLK